MVWSKPWRTLRKNSWEGRVPSCVLRRSYSRNIGLSVWLSRLLWIDWRTTDWRRRSVFQTCALKDIYINLLSLNPIWPEILKLPTPQYIWNSSTYSSEIWWCNKNNKDAQFHPGKLFCNFFSLSAIRSIPEKLLIWHSYFQPRLFLVGFIKSVLILISALPKEIKKKYLNERVLYYE